MKYRKTTADELALIMDEGEGYMLEFKRNVNSDLPKELVAFANASGGRIVIGIEKIVKIFSIILGQVILKMMIFILTRPEYSYSVKHRLNTSFIPV